MKINAKESEAMAWAYALHKDQVDKSGEPYFLHVMRVAMASAYHKSEDVFIAAILHDAVEDCGVTLADIEAKYGARCAGFVDSLTRRKGERYSAFIDRCAKDYIATQIKIQDIRDNLRPERQLGFDDERRIKRYESALKVLLAVIW